MGSRREVHPGGAVSVDVEEEDEVELALLDGEVQEQRPVVLLDGDLLLAEHLGDDTSGDFEGDLLTGLLIIVEPSEDDLSVSADGLDDVVVRLFDLPRGEVDPSPGAGGFQLGEAFRGARRGGLLDESELVALVISGGGSYLDASEGLHPLVEVDDSVAADVDEVEEVLDDGEAWDRGLGEFAQADDELVELVEGHSPGIVLVELPISTKNEKLT